MAARTLAQLWPVLGVDERLHVFLERYRAETQKVPTTEFAQGYAACVDDLTFYILDVHPLPPESFK